jgi:hypothetical protein
MATSFTGQRWVAISGGGGGGGSVNWGGIGGTIGSQTDLIAMFATKQNTLQAGVNITPLVTTSLDGFMRAADKRKLDSNYYLQNAPGSGSTLLRYVNDSLTYARLINFGAGFDTASSTADVINVTATGLVSSVHGRTGAVVGVLGDYSAFYAPLTRSISTTAPLAGGGDLSANRTFSINTNGITYSLMQQVAANRLLGNSTGALANAQEISLGYGLVFGTGLLRADTTSNSGLATKNWVIAQNYGSGGGGGVSTVFGRAGAVVAQANDYTWAQIDKTTSSIADLATRSAADLNSGTLPDARLSTNVVKKDAEIDLNAQAVFNASVKKNSQTGTTYTLLASDNGKVLYMNNAAAITITVPSGLPAGFNCTVVQRGAGQVTFATSGTTIVNGSSHTKTKGLNATVTLFESETTNTYVLAGETGT